MVFRQFVASETGCTSYLIGCERGGRAAVVDPLDDVSPYLTEAAHCALRITHIIETHSHPERVSGARRLSAVTGAPLLTREPPPECQGDEVDEEEEHELGLVWLTLIQTSGFAGATVAVVVTDRARGRKPCLVLCGEPLSARMRQRLPALPEDVAIYAAHALEPRLCLPERGDREH